MHFYAYAKHMINKYSYVNHVYHKLNYTVGHNGYMTFGMMMSISHIFMTAPGMAEKVVASARSPSLMTVGWDAPSGGVKGYTVSLEDDDGAHPAEQRDESTRTATFKGLTAGTEYTVRVVTLSGDQQSETAEYKFYTSTYKQQ